MDGRQHRSSQPHESWILDRFPFLCNTKRMKITHYTVIIATLLVTLTLAGKERASERDSADYYRAHLSDFKGKEIQLLAEYPSVVGETEIKEGYVDIRISTEHGGIPCLVKKDRVEAFLNRYRGMTPKILRGTLLVTENENPYLLVDGF